MRTAGPKWNHAKLYVKFAALWFFLVKRDGSEEGAPVHRPEWPSPRFDYRQIFRIDRVFEPGQLSEMAAFGSSGEWT